MPTASHLNRMFAKKSTLRRFRTITAPIHVLGQAARSGLSHWSERPAAGAPSPLRGEGRGGGAKRICRGSFRLHNRDGGNCIQCCSLSFCISMKIAVDNPRKNRTARLVSHPRPSPPPSRGRGRRQLASWAKATALPVYSSLLTQDENDSLIVRSVLNGRAGNRRSDLHSQRPPAVGHSSLSESSLTLGEVAQAAAAVSAAAPARRSRAACAPWRPRNCCNWDAPVHISFHAAFLLGHMQCKSILY
jgi:hypothetical protein